MKQAIRVLDHLESGKTITSLHAFKDLGITRLAAVIYDLRKDGHLIQKRMISVKNRFDENCSVAEYYLEGCNG